MELVKEYFQGEGSISASGGNMYFYEVSSIKALVKVREHFELYPLQSTKYVYFKLWCQAMDIIEKREHLTDIGFKDILAIKSVFKRGLSLALCEAYPDIIPRTKPVFVPSIIKLDHNWIAGFTQSDGTFGLNPTVSPRMRLGSTITPQFRITQHERDLILLNRIIESMGCGYIVPPYSDRDRCNVNVGGISDLVNIVVPLFEKHPVYGAKRSDFLDFCKGMCIFKDGKHLTPEGLKALKDIAHGMNTGRKF